MDEQDHLQSLNIEHNDVKVGKGYSWFVKSMRWGLPILAIALTFVVIAWPKVEDKLVVVPKEELVKQPTNEIGENELLSPHFETIDSNQNPINVTATRALQSQENPNLVKLENPNADLKMQDGSPVNIKALSGTYEQETEKLFLQTDVEINHAAGYELTAEELRVDMKTREAFSDKNVSIEGPAAKIDAVGLEGNMDDGILIFKGPAKLTLKPSKTNKPNEQLQNKVP